MSFFSELKRRNVFRVGAAYLVVAWLLLQIVDTVGPMLSLSDAFGRGVLLLIAIGFPIFLIIAWVFELTSEGLQTQATADASGARTYSGKLNTLIVGGMALVIVFLVIDNYILNDSTETPEHLVEEVSLTPEETAGLAQVLGEKLGRDTSNENSVAVLPFRDLSPDGDQSWFADGLSEEIRNLLTRVDGLDVINTNSSFFFRDREDDFQSIREELDVNYLLSGSVRKAGENLRIGVQLSATADGNQTWSNNYEGTLDDIFTVQDEIAVAVSDALEITLGVGELGSIPGMTRNPEAYALYLEASQGNGITANDFRRRIALLEQALELDDKFVEASGAIINQYRNSNVLTSDSFPEREERVAQARDHIRSLMPDHLIFLEDEVKEAVNAGDWLLVEERYGRIAERLELSQSNQELLENAVLFLFFTGRITESIPMIERLRAMDPKNPFIHYFLSEGMARLGQFERSYASIEQAIELRPNDPFLMGGRLLTILGERDMEKLRVLPIQTDYNKIGLENLDSPDQAIALYHELLDAGGVPPIFQSLIAAWLAFFGDYEGALAIQEIVAARNKLTVPFDTFRSVYAGMRRQPGFKDLMIDIGLVEYWRTTGDWGDFCRPIEESDDFECF